MSQVKAEVALNLLKYFRWLVQSYKTTLVNFYIAQKQIKWGLLRRLGMQAHKVIGS